MAAIVTTNAAFLGVSIPSARAKGRPLVVRRAVVKARASKKEDDASERSVPREIVGAVAAAALLLNADCQVAHALEESPAPTDAWYLTDRWYVKYVQESPPQLTSKADVPKAEEKKKKRQKRAATAAKPPSAVKAAPAPKAGLKASPATEKVKAAAASYENRDKTPSRDVVGFDSNEFLGVLATLFFFYSTLGEEDEEAGKNKSAATTQLYGKKMAEKVKQTPTNTGATATAEPAQLTAEENAASAQAWIDAWMMATGKKTGEETEEKTATSTAETTEDKTIEANVVSAQGWINSWQSIFSKKEKESTAETTSAAPATPAAPQLSAEENAASAQAWIDAWMSAQSTATSTAATSSSASSEAIVYSFDTAASTFDNPAATAEAALPAAAVAVNVSGDADTCVDERLEELGPEAMTDAKKWIANWKEKGMPTEESKKEEAKGWIEGWKESFNGADK